jgi:hypothetical protein
METKKRLTNDSDNAITVVHFEGERLDVNRMKCQLMEFLPGLTGVDFAEGEVLGCPNIHIDQTPSAIRRENSSGDDEQEIELASITSSQLRANTVCARLSVRFSLSSFLFLAIATSEVSRCAGFGL